MQAEKNAFLSLYGSLSCRPSVCIGGGRGKKQLGKERERVAHTHTHTHTHAHTEADTEQDMK